MTAVVLDLDGVLWLGDEPLPGAAEAVARFRAAGLAVGFMTNNSSLPVAGYVEKLARFGVDADPSEVPDAKFIPEITHKDALTQGLRVMDSTAFALCMDNNLPIVVFNMADGRNIDKIVSGQRVGTLVRT